MSPNRQKAIVDEVPGESGMGQDINKSSSNDKESRVVTGSTPGIQPPHEGLVLSTSVPDIVNRLHKLLMPTTTYPMRSVNVPNHESHKEIVVMGVERNGQDPSQTQSEVNERSLMGICHRMATVAIAVAESDKDLGRMLGGGDKIVVTAQTRLIQ